jgi:hypothetical protein
VQCCYDPDTGELSDSGSYDFQAPPYPLDFLFNAFRAFADLIEHILVDIWPFGEVWGAEFPDKP